MNNYEKRFQYSIKNPHLDDEAGENYAAKMATRHSNWAKSLEAKRGRAGRVAAFAADKFGSRSPIAIAARVRLRECYPPQIPRGVQRSPQGVGGGSYAQ